VALGANHDALLDLVENALPVAVCKCRTDVERFLAEVVELEDYRIVLTAVDARVSDEELDQVGSAFARQLLLLGLCLIDVALTVGGVVLFAVVRPARTAERDALIPRFPAPGEVLDWLGLAASVALR